MNGWIGFIWAVNPAADEKSAKASQTGDSTIEEQKSISTSDQEVSGIVQFYCLFNCLLGIPVITRMLYIVASVLVSTSLLLPPIA